LYDRKIRLTFMKQLGANLDIPKSLVIDNKRPNIKQSTYDRRQTKRTNTTVA
jgi:hypothetical protein